MKGQQWRRDEGATTEEMKGGDNGRDEGGRQWKR
jgi:hypothetical protein